MPCVGLSPFLLSYENAKSAYNECVNALCRAIPISTWLKKDILLIRNCSVSMPCVGLSPFLPNILQCQRMQKVSMPCVGLSPFLRSPLGTRINRGHNLETIHVIVRQFIFTPIFTPFFPSFDISAFFPKMVRLMTFLLYTFFDTGSSCFFLFRSFPMHLISWEYHKRHPDGCLYVICCLRFIWYLICCISIISPPISSYFLHSINSFLCTTTCYFIKIVVGNKTLIICSPPFAFHCFVLLKDFFQNFSNNKW